MRKSCAEHRTTPVATQVLPAHSTPKTRKDRAEKA
jgi:hypothetical protein